MEYKICLIFQLISQDKKMSKIKWRTSQIGETPLPTHRMILRNKGVSDQLASMGTLDKGMGCHWVDNNDGVPALGHIVSDRFKKIRSSPCI